MSNPYKPRRVRAALFTAAEEIRDRLTPSHIDLDDPRAEEYGRRYFEHKKKVWEVTRARAALRDQQPVTRDEEGESSAGDSPS